MDSEQRSPKPTFHRRRWNTAAYDTYSDGFTFREELNFEYGSESSSSDSDPPVIDLASEGEEQEAEKRVKRRTVENSIAKKRKSRRRWKNMVRSFKSLQKWRIRSMDAIFLHPFDSWQPNGFRTFLLPSSNRNPRQIQAANIEPGHVSDISVVVENELARNNEAAADFVPSPQESQASSESSQRVPNFAVQTLPPIQEFFAASTSEIAMMPPPLMQDRSFRSAARFAAEPLSVTQNTFRPSTSEMSAVHPSPMQDRSSASVPEFAMEAPSMMQNTFGPRAPIPIPPMAPLVQNKSTSEIAAVPPPSTQTRSSISDLRFEPPPMTPNMYNQWGYGSIPQPSPFLQNAGALGQAMEMPSMPQNMFGPRPPFFIPPPSPFLQNTSAGEFAAEPPSLMQNVFRPGVPTRPARIASGQLPFMPNNLPPRRFEARPHSSMQRNRFSASRGFDDPRFVNGVPRPLNLPPPLIPITPELYPICDRIARRQREQRRLQQLQKINHE